MRRKCGRRIIIIRRRRVYFPTNANTNVTNTVWKAVRKASAIQAGRLLLIDDMTL